MSRLRRISALLTGTVTLEGLTGPAAADLDKKVCQAIVKELDLKAANLKPILDFSAWAARTSYHDPLEVFTINYDLLIETAFEEFQVPYFDGFLGTLRSRFRTDLVEPMQGSPCMPAFFVRLWKLHGSLNWEWDESQRIYRCGHAVEKSAAIYPSDTKYDESRRMPFVVLQDRFRRALHHPETLALVAGYSFGDDHLNEIIFEAASRRQRSEIVVFSFDGIPATLAERAEITPNIQVASPHEAIIGGLRGEWEASEHAPANIWAGDKFLLGNFKHLAAYLAKSATKEDDLPMPATTVAAASAPPPAAIPGK